MGDRLQILQLMACPLSLQAVPRAESSLKKVSAAQNPSFLKSTFSQLHGLIVSVQTFGPILLQALVGAGVGVFLAAQVAVLPARKRSESPLCLIVIHTL